MSIMHLARSIANCGIRLQLPAGRIMPVAQLTRHEGVVMLKLVDMSAVCYLEA